MNLILKVTFLLLFISCSQTIHSPEKIILSDTSYAFQIFLDTFFTFKYDQLRHPRKEIGDTIYTTINSYFEGNNYGDSLIFLKDSIYSKYIPSGKFKIKLLDYNEICDKLYECEKTNRPFPAIIEIKYDHYRDSIFHLMLASYVPHYTKDSNGNYKEKIDGGFYSGSDTCRSGRWLNCGPLFFRNVIITKAGIRLENKFIK